MYSLESSQTNVPAFLAKLWKLVEDPLYDHLITWGATQNSFIIKNQTDFAKQLLPLYFKHNNMASFIRQLNIYGFRKLTNITKSNMYNEGNEVEFYHPCFTKETKEHLSFIKRKASSSSGRSADTISNSSDTIQDILADVKVLKVRQENVDSLLSAMTQENEALWREIVLLRQKHTKQQQIVVKLIQFLLAIVQPTTNRRKLLKRTLPLMIKEGKEISDEQFIPEKKWRDDNTQEGQSLVIRDVTDHLDNENLSSSPRNQAACSSSSQTGNSLEVVDSATSPILDTNVNPIATLEQLNMLEPLQSLNDVIDPNQVDSQLLEILNPNILNETTDLDNCVKNLSSKSPLVTSSDTLTYNTEDDLLSEAKIILNTNKEIAKSDASQIASSNSESSFPKIENLSKNSFTEHLEQVDNELSWLYDQLSGEQNINSSNLLSLFNADENIIGNALNLDCIPEYKTENQVTGDGLETYPLLQLWNEEPEEDSNLQVL